MQFGFPFLDSLSIPTDFDPATGTGVLIDANGITVYVNGDIAIRIGDPNTTPQAIQFSSRNVNEDTLGEVSGDVATIYGLTRAILQLKSPEIATQEPSFLELFDGEDSVGSTAPGIRIGRQPNVGVTCGPRIILRGNSGLCSVGRATLVAGTVLVSNPLVRAETHIMLSRETTGGTPGHLSSTRVNDTSFTINSSSATDTSVIAYLLVDRTS